MAGIKLFGCLVHTVLLLPSRAAALSKQFALCSAADPDTDLEKGRIRIRSEYQDSKSPFLARSIDQSYDQALLSQL